MDEILRNLPPGARVLDLGSMTGSFSLDRCPAAKVVRLDLETPKAGSPPGFVRADASQLPFPDHCFDAVISNHSLEHIYRFEAALAEIGRVTCPSGSLYFAVPDASTFSDWLYRWLCRGGGHINPFCSATALSSEVTRRTGFPLAGTRDLCSSFRFLKRSYFGPRAPRRLLLAANGNRFFIMLLSFVARKFDSLFPTRLSFYGWALYFGNLAEPVESVRWTNVCVECGSASPAIWLREANLVRRRWLVFKTYLCPACASLNFFTPDD
jgi:SAM-dependent methyltransferase